MGVVFRGDEVYTTETHYHIIRVTTGSGLSDASGVLPHFGSPAGVALDQAGAHLFIADTTNNAVQKLSFDDNSTTTFLDTTEGLNRPVDVGVDNQDNIYVLNQGSGTDGAILEFDRFGNLLATNAAGLSLPTAMSVDGHGNILAVGQGGQVWQISAGSSQLVAMVTDPKVSLQGIARFSDGTLAVSDAGNHVIRQINPISGVVSLLTGSPGAPGSTLGASNYARLNQPQRLALASGDLLLAADSGNNRVVVVARNGAVTNVLNSTNSIIWFGRAVTLPERTWDAFCADGLAGRRCPRARWQRLHLRSVLSSGRLTLDSGLSEPGSGPAGEVSAPSITPSSGYYPMGQFVQVSSANPDVYYTTDGSAPNTNSLKLGMNGNVGVIPGSARRMI